MDSLTASIVTALSVNYFTAFTADAVRRFFSAAFKLRPSLERDLKAAQTSEQLEKVLADAVGVIEANAGHGTIDVDGGILRALKAIKFDHQHGQVTIAGSTVQSAVLVTGGSDRATGKTLIGGNTSLRSSGTSIEVGHGCAITMTGGASIKQT